MSKTPWQTLHERLLDLEEAPIHPVEMSIVIPTYNSAHTIRWTLDSLQKQEFGTLEVIVIDAGSTDVTLDVVRKGFRGPLRIYSVAEFNLAEMYNRGISLATGRYVGFLLPGDVYLSPKTLKAVAQVVVDNEEPNLIYGGCLLRGAGQEPSVLLNEMGRTFLEKGRQPTSLQACWIRADTLRSVGKFDANYVWRAPFDLMCRLHFNSNLRAVGIKRVLVDHERRGWNTELLLRRSWETQAIVRHYFGKKAWLKWWLGMNPFKVIAMWWRSYSATS